MAQYKWFSLFEKTEWIDNCHLKQKTHHHEFFLQISILDDKLCLTFSLMYFEIIPIILLKIQT